MRYKYPRTLHLPWSLGVQSDDKMLPNVNCFLGKQIVITEKMDGENTSMYCDHIHARSTSSVHHYTQDWVKAFWNGFSYLIPEGMRICGENLYAEHSIEYRDLESYFYGFSIWQEDICLNWDETKEWAEKLGIHLAPVLYEGEFDEKKIKGALKDLDLNKSEGYVIRNRDSFNMSDFSSNVAKFVRNNHVQTDKHWKHQKITPNGLKG